MEDVTSLLERMVMDELKIVSYKSLSRELRIDTNAAKKILSDYVEKSPAVHATYAIIGNEENQAPAGRLTRILLCPQEELEEKRATLVGCTFHIYSIEPRKLNDFDDLTNAGCDLMLKDTPDLWSTCRPIKCPHITERARAAGPAPGSRKAEEVILSPSKFMSKNKRPEEPAPKPSKPAKKAKTDRKGSFFENQIKKDNARKEKEAEEATRNEEARKKRMDRVRAEELRMELQSKDAVDAIHRMFEPEEGDYGKRKKVDESEDEENQSDVDDPESKRLKAIKDATVSLEDEVAKPVEDDLLFSNSDEDEKAENNEAEEVTYVEKGEAPETVTRRVKRRRQVTRQKHTKTGKYMVTKDVTEWEEYSTDEEVIVRPKKAAPPPVQPIAVADSPKKVDDGAGAVAGGPSGPAARKEPSPTKEKKKGKKKAVTGQKTLESFFGRKQ
ncbi:hypothetical protein HK101_002673 [Irineochytrium annulatum]|nr:hypothetical protein HK101_002673 [Irineochytrium annulatum]